MANDNNNVTFGDKCFRQVIGIPMGTDCAPFLANLFLFAYEFKWLDKQRKHNRDVYKFFRYCGRYIDDLMLINNDGQMKKVMADIYPKELVLVPEDSDDQSCSFLDLQVVIKDSVITTSIFDKRDAFDFPIINFPTLTGNIPNRSSYGVFIGELDGTPDRPDRLGGYSLGTFWIMVEYQGVTGYALNAEIINFPPLEWNGSYYEFEKERLQGYFKKEIVLHKRQDSTLVEGRYWVSFIDSLAFPDGSYYKVDLFDGCFDRSYHFKEKTIAQVYFIFKTVYTVRVNYADKEKQENEYPSFSDASKYKLLFIPGGVTASDGLFIRLSEHLVFGSSDCT